MGGSMWCPECEEFTVHLYIHCCTEHPERFHKMMELKEGKKLGVRGHKMDYVLNCKCSKCKEETKRLLA